MRVVYFVSFVLALLAGCDGWESHTCAEHGCSVRVTSDKQTYALGERIELTVVVSSRTEVVLNRYSNDLCNFRLKTSTDKSTYVLGNVLCSTNKKWNTNQPNPLPQEGSREMRESFLYSMQEKQVVSPEGPWTIQLSADTYMDDSDEVYVRFSEEVYFSFSESTRLFLILNEDSGSDLIPKFLDSVFGAIDLSLVRNEDQTVNIHISSALNFILDSN